MRNIVPLLMMFIFLSFNLHAEWIPVSKDANESEPNVTIISNDESGIVVKVDLYGFYLNQFKTGFKTYHSTDLMTEVFTNKTGLPEIAYISKILAIPDDASVSVEVLNTGEKIIYSNILLNPAQESWFEGLSEPSYTENIQAYSSSSLYPSSNAELEDPVVFRDFRIARLSIFPLRYSAAKKELELTTSLTVKIKYGKGEVINPKLSERRPIPSSFGSIYRSVIFNYTDVLDKYYNGKEEGHELMLCIMPDEFYDSFQDYAQWKRESGIDIHITKFSDISANSSNPDIIKNHISYAYYNWDIAPTYVLIIGDDGVFPKKYVYYDYSFPNEDFFVEIEGNDYFPEMMIGRFSNQTDYRLQVMVNKFQKYEKEPFVDDPTWFRKGICCSNNAYESQVGTKRFTANRMLEEGGFISVDTLMSDGDPYGGTPCTMDNQDVLDALNDGRSYLNYRGEGWSSGWWASCTPFQTEDVMNLNNGQKLTFVTSIGCGVAMFDAGGGNCFGETWVKLGTLSSPRGAVAFVGPTSNTHTTYNNKIDKGIYVGMFRESMDTPGQALLRGRLYMYNVFGGTDPWVEYHYRVYCILGDPGIHIWKNTPLPVDVSYSFASNNITVDVTRNPEGAVDSAQVTIVNDTYFASAFTDETGTVVIEGVPDDGSDLLMTVRGDGVYPYQEVVSNNSGINMNELVNVGLNQNIPNPFNSETVINFILSEDDNISLIVYDINGKKVRTLINENLIKGEYSVSWNGINDSGDIVSSGIYYYSLISTEGIQTKKMLIIK